MAMDPILIACAIFFLVSCVFLHRKLLPSGRQLPPGPVNFPVVGALPWIGPMPHVGLAKLAHRYGPIMYFKMGSSNVVVASSAAAARTFLNTHDLQFSDRPRRENTREITTYGGQNFVFGKYGPRWKLTRKLLHAHMLSVRALSRWSAIRRDEIGRVLQAMHDSSRRSRTVAPFEIVMCANANVLGRMMVSRRLFGSPGEESNQFMEAVTGMLRVMGRNNIGDLVPALAKLDPFGVQKTLHRVHGRLDELISRAMAEHEATAHEREAAPDVLDLIKANRKEGGQELSDVNIRAIIFDMFIAGTDSSTAAIEWALAEMLKNPAIFKRAQAEIDAVVGRDRRLEESDISKLPYLRALCKEVLRLHPSAPLGVPRYVSSACEVAGYRIPEKARLFVNLWAIGRDPSHWESPLEFKPERFLSGRNAGVEPFGNDWELIPFGGGRRICPGMYMGMLTLQYFVGALIHAFEWRSIGSYQGDVLNMDEKFGAVVTKAVPLKAMISPRLPPAAYV